MMQSSVSHFSEQWYEFYRLLWTRITTIVLFTSSTILVTFFGTMLQKPLYLGSTTLLIDVESPNLMSVSTSRDEAMMSEANYLTYADYFQTQVEILMSRTIAHRVFDNLKLSGQKRFRRARDPVEKLLKQVKVKPVKLSRLAKVQVLDPNPAQAAAIANEFAQVFVENNLTKTTSDETLTLMKNEYLKLQSKEGELSKRYKAKFPVMVRLREQMNQLAQLLEEETKRQLRAGQAAAGGSSGGSEETTASLIERLRQNSMVGGLKPNNIRIVDYAQVPKKQAKPNVKLNMILGFLLGIIGGIGMAVTQELLDSSLKNPEDIQKDSRLTLLGYVPQIAGLTERDNVSFPERYQQISLKPQSPASEAYRTVRTNLIYAAPQEESQVLIVTSAASGEGKTTTATNMAISLAQLGLKILLVDADLRRPCLHRVFELKQSPGLSEYLVGKVPPQSLPQPTNVPGLSVVTSGVCPPNPAELLGSAKMRHFIEQVAGQFERTMLDCPPVLPVTDAAILAGMAGKVVAVAQSGKTPRQALHQLITVCEGARAKVLGVVLNHVSNLAASTYYGYSSYSYGTPPDGPGGANRDARDLRRNRDGKSSVLRHPKKEKESF